MPSRRFRRKRQCITKQKFMELRKIIAVSEQMEEETLLQVTMEKILVLELQVDVLKSLLEIYGD
uniref:Uncharacterized protein n=1 Tax=Nelumbo nucifera TaxID=4432 RepID=A0A822ZRJ5_NELNU|nr:TPA_asm: hypothetical protein HUJ06_003796 [Nelumbo nucifera]